MRTILTSALTSAALVVAAAPAQASFFTASGIVVGEPTITLDDATGSISFTDASLVGVIHVLPGWYTPFPYQGVLNFTLPFQLGTTLYGRADLAGVVRSYSQSTSRSLNAQYYFTRVSLVDDMYNGELRLGGEVVGDGHGGITVYFQGSQNSGFTSRFVFNVPEPSTWGLMLTGFGIIGSSVRRRRVAFAI